MHYPSKVVKRRGFTALELIIVLVVGFSIIALSASKMGQLFSESATASAMGSILELFTATRSLRGATGYGDTTDDLIVPLMKAGMVPKSLAVAKGENNTADKLLNEWQGEININPLARTDGIGFTLSYDQVPGGACSKLAQNLLHSGNFMSINIAGKDITVSDKVLNVVNTCATAPATGKTGVKMAFKFVE